jgi:hypothetical protein
LRDRLVLACTEKRCDATDLVDEVGVDRRPARLRDAA